MQTNGNEEIRSKPHQFPKTSFAEHLMEGHNSTTSMARAAGQGGIILIEFPLFRAFFSRLQFGEADKRNRFSSILSYFFLQAAQIASPFTGPYPTSTSPSRVILLCAIDFQLFSPSFNYLVVFSRKSGFSVHLGTLVPCQCSRLGCVVHTHLPQRIYLQTERPNQGNEIKVSFLGGLRFPVTGAPQPSRNAENSKIETFLCIEFPPWFNEDWAHHTRQKVYAHTRMWWWCGSAAFPGVPFGLCAFGGTFAESTMIITWAQHQQNHPAASQSKAVSGNNNNSYLQTNV